ncbi:DNA-binding response regulator, OmpR family, contains REC and winged-helix (wHTH) domain [Saccharicrinis carchari]|uniref:DNA-binding response regulator, OmpR family, contains REC and winged-helix (WHTH) domain n=1 Tax=Saccharicrinis carchari TaxID=1168039 RepID=A0A521DCK4_SACCC|nr:response regulator transcription factor [Saccharicrinis carchari]SMO69413.1 DNA-binding response regulator, OmpR family, contains REC and winged-helix (wHTH) domain [Saccharicrinis carchari]
MDKKTKILLVEDDTTMGFLLVDFLETKGFEVKLYPDGIQGITAFNQNNFDFCILDVMLPGLDGFGIAQRIRKKNKVVPIIFLTAKALKHDKITGFGIGVDDYIVKPFDEDELLCRINAILNRCKTTTEPMQKMDIGQFKFDADNLLLTIGKEQKRLTQKENEVLKMLACSKNSLVKRDEILLALWGNNDYFNSRSLDVFIAKLRRYLKADTMVQIENVPTVGFVLRDQAVN